MDIETISTWAPTALSSTIYVGVHTVFAAHLLRKKPVRQKIRVGPRVSILKPMAGVDDDLRENLESFARIEYRNSEILLGLASQDDAALPIARAFIAAHAELDVRLVFTDPTAAANPKVAQLLGLAREATGEVLVVSDANVRVAPSYLADLMGALLRPGIGLVSSLVVGTGERTIGAALENAQLGAFVAPSVVVSDRIAGRGITVGKSMAMRRVDLECVGGFRGVASVLAEDDVLGQRFREKGYGVELSLTCVENRNMHCSIAKSLDRHTRWAKMRRAILPLGFAFEFLLTPMIVAALVLAVAPSIDALRALVLAWALQCMGVTIALRLLRSRWPSWQIVAIEPLRALILVICWVRAWTSRRVEWRGAAFRIGAGTTLTPIEQDVPASGRAMP